MRLCFRTLRLERACLDTRPRSDRGLTKLIRKLTLGLGCALAVASQAHAEDSFPRLGGVLIGNPQNYWDAAYQADIAKLDVVVLSAFPGWGSSQKTTMDAATKAIKAKNPNTKVFLYVIAESQKSPVPSVWSELGQKVEQEQWWLYQGGLTKVSSGFGHDMYQLNITSYAKPDSSGKKFNQWFAQYMADKLATPNSAIDGFFTDNVFWKPREDGDWNLDGKMDSRNDPTVQKWLRQGQVEYVTALRKVMPGKLQIANVADWGEPSAVLTEYQGKFNGGVLEGIIGASYSAENKGWAPMMLAYRKTMAAFGDPKLGIFQMNGDPKDYRGFRYGFASCLMDDGYFAFNESGKGYSGVPMFDEYQVKLGKAVSKPSMLPWSAGVYRRDFENGIALVNPKGNGAQEVTLESDFFAVKGTQDPAVNSGKAVRKVRLEDRDGIILLRQRAVHRPTAPPNVSAASN